MGSCCSTLVPKYAQHIESLLPLPLSKAEVKTMGGVLAQDDVTKWKTRVSTSDMTAYAKAMPDKLALMGIYCQKKIKAELARGRMRFAAIYMLALIALVEACHSDEQLSLYDSSVCNSMLLLFEHPNHELQILAAQCLCALLKAQADPGSDSHNRKLPVSSVYSSSDYSKYAMFYPFVLKMASRNPSSSVLSQLGASAQKLFRDKDKEVTKSHQRSTSQSNNEPQTPNKADGAVSAAPIVPLSKRKRVKDLAELEVIPGSNPHQRGSSLSLNRNGNNAASTPAASDKADKSVQLNDPAGAEQTEDPTKQRISLWRSRYFGLKALSYLFQYNKDTSASFSRLTEILPILLINFPKTKRSLKAVVKEYDADTMNRIDETYKHFHSSSSSDEKTAVVVPATAENNVAGSPVVNNNQSSVNFSASTKKGDDLASKTGITLLHVQLFAYDALIALCNLPSISLHTAVIYKEVFHWLDQSQTILSRTTMQGIPTTGPSLTVPPSAGAGVAATPSSSGAAGPSPTTPIGWEDLYFTSHLFIDVLCKQLPFENGSIDQLVFALMQHMEAMEEKDGGLIHSKRGSKMIEEVLTPIELIGEESKSQAAATLAGGAPAAAPSTPQKEKTTLAQDIKQLFKKKSSLSISGRGSAASRQIKLTQNAILALLNNLLFQAGDMYSNDVHTTSNSTRVTRAFSVSSVDEPHGSRLVLMNAQFLTESYLAHVQTASRSVDLLKRIQSRGSVSAPSLANLGSSGASASSSSMAAGADQAQLEYEASLEASLSLSVDFLHSYTRVFPQLFAQRFYSYNDVLSCLSYMISRAMKATGVSEQHHANKSTYLDACYAMSIGLIKWGSGRTGAAGAGEIDNKGLADDLYSLDQSNLSSATLYETLINSILSCIACEIDADLRAQAYKILESVLMCMGGFGGRWSALPSSSLLLNQAATLGSSWGNLSGVSLARNISGNPSMDIGSAPAHTSSLEVPGARDEEKSQVSRSGAGNALESSAVVGISGIEPSPSPHHGVSAFSDRASLSGAAGASKADLRARRIPQIFASCMDVKSNSGANGGSNSASALTSHSALLSTQYHRWIYSVIYYEITACFSSIPPAAAGNIAADGSSSSSIPVPKDLTPFQIAGGILKPRGRGHTSNENIILCFQILTLLLLQRHGSNSTAGVGRSGNDPVTIQQILSLQLPMMLRLNTYLTSTNSEEKFYLKTAQNLKLQSFLYTHLFFVSKLLLLNVDSHWLRQQSVNLEEYLATVQSDRTRKGEGLGSELEGSWLYGLVENQAAVLGQGSVTEINTNFDNAQLVAILAKVLVEKPNGESSLNGGANNSAADETLDQLIAAQQVHLSHPASFEPFNLAFLLPEQSLREKSDRENSTSWAPSRFTGAQLDGGADESLRHGPASASPAELAGAAAVASASGDFEFGSHTPRMQYSPGLRAKGPNASPSLRALDIGPNATGSFTGSSSLGPIEASPQPQQSAADILLEIDQQSFSSISSLAAKTSLKQQVQFEHFMMELDTHTAANPQAINTIAQAITHQKKSSSGGVSLLHDESKAASTASSSSSTHTSADAIAKANAFIYDLNSKGDGFDLTRPASNSTLELSFPQLASFDMYLHSELDA